MAFDCNVRVKYNCHIIRLFFKDGTTNECDLETG